MTSGKERLDKLLVERGLVETRSKAQAIIMAGEVTVDGKRVDKAGTAVPIEAEIDLAQPLPYVSRGGYKLAGALDTFGIDVAERICADVGACTGGFTDVMLQQGAKRVYAIDVGQGQLDWKLRQNERVVVMERVNARHQDQLPEPVSFVAIDVSFISLRLIFPSVQQWLADDGEVVALIKPQFEAGPELVGKGGIVRDAAVHQQVLESMLSWVTGNGWGVAGLMASPIHGAGGNREFLIWLNRQPAPLDSDRLILQALG